MFRQPLETDRCRGRRTTLLVLLLFVLSLLLLLLLYTIIITTLINNNIITHRTCRQRHGDLTGETGRASLLLRCRDEA